MTNEELINQRKKEIVELTSQIDKSKINYDLPMGSWVSYKESEIFDRERMTIAERNNKLRHFINCLKCEVSGKCCDDNCSTQYEAGTMGEIIENLEAISKALEQEPTTKNNLGVDWDELKRKIFMEVNGGTDDRWLRYIDVCDNISNSIDEFKADLPSTTPQLSSGLEKNSQKLEKDFGELDCISRADARSLVVKIDRKYMYGMSGKAFQDLYKGIDEIPSVTPQEPKTGHWFVDERPESNREVICSNCEQSVFKYHKLDFDYRPKFCPNCGARMVKPRESEEDNGSNNN